MLLVFLAGECGAGGARKAPFLGAGRRLASLPAPLRAQPPPGQGSRTVRPLHPPQTGGAGAKAGPWEGRVRGRRDIRPVSGGGRQGNPALLFFSAVSGRACVDIRLSHVAGAGRARPAASRPAILPSSRPGIVSIQWDVVPAAMRPVLPHSAHPEKGGAVVVGRGHRHPCVSRAPPPAPLPPRYIPTHRPHEAVLGVKGDECIVFALARAVGKGWE